MKKLVIVADDERDSADMLALLIRAKWGVCVHTVYDGGAAVDLVQAEHPAVVILDLDMPVVNGMDAAEAIRRSSAGGAVPELIALSGSVELVSSPRAKSAFDHTFSKPVDLMRLMEILAPSCQ